MWQWLAQNATQLEAIAAAVTALGFFLTAVSLWQTARAIRQAAREAQATRVQGIAQTGRELMFKAIGDWDLRPVIDSWAVVRDDVKFKTFLRIVIQHFATAYRQWRLGQLPAEYWEEIERDARDFFRMRTVRNIWDEVRRYYREDFARFVEKLQKEVLP